jgi:WD40 repeat protein
MVEATMALFAFYHCNGGSLTPALVGGNPPASFSPDDRSIITVSDDKTARVWRQIADDIWSPIAHEFGEAIVSASYAAERIYIATTSEEGVGKVWWLRSDGSKIDIDHFRWNYGSLISASVLPDGRRMVTTSSDGTARLWWQIGRRGPNRQTILLYESAPIETNQYFTSFASIAPDGRQIVTASRDGAALAWEIVWPIGDAGGNSGDAHNPRHDLIPAHRSPDLSR